MKHAADRLKEGNEATTGGGVVSVHNEFRARVQYSEGGDPREIEGPCRSSEFRTKADLELIIAAAAEILGRAERFEAMAAEAHRLQDAKLTSLKLAAVGVKLVILTLGESDATTAQVAPTLAKF